MTLEIRSLAARCLHLVASNAQLHTLSDAAAQLTDDEVKAAMACRVALKAMRASFDCERLTPARELRAEAEARLRCGATRRKR